MKTTADYEYEYVVCNRMPLDHAIDPDSQWAYLFFEPIRIFGTGSNALQLARQWSEETNRMRDDARRKTGRGFEVDNVAGEIINTEVRRRLIIKLGYERVESTDHPSGLRVDMIEELSKNWVPA